jgi:outer membrane protein assembly factor BamB
VDIKSGEVKWSFRPLGWICQSLSVASKSIFLTSGVSNLYRLSLVKGGDDWQIYTSVPIVSPPAVVGDILIIGCKDNFLYGMDISTGKKQWNVNTKHPVELTPAAADGVIFVVNMYGELMAIE